MNITRRWFSALLPAAPAIATSGVNHLGEKAVESYPTSPMSGLETIIKTVAPPQLAQYHKAMELSHRINRFHYRRSEVRHECDPNIDALKSVSNQHKIIMYMKRDEERRFAEQTFSDVLIKELGLGDWFKKQESERPLAGTAAYTRY